MPSLNDHTIDGSGGIGPGLGRDEPTPEVKASFQDKRQANMERMMTEISVKTEELNVREKRLDERELDVVRALKSIKEREDDLAKRLNAETASKKTQTNKPPATAPKDPTPTG